MRGRLIFWVLIISLPFCLAQAGDVNGDLMVDLNDLIFMTLNLGNSGFDPAADLNSDGMVNIFDMVVVARNYGNDYTSQPPPSNPLPSGLIAAWPFDEGTGTATQDATGNGNTGSINGASWTTGIYGNALSFDGTDDYVNVGTLKPFYDILASSWSITLWTSTTNTGSGVVVGTVDSGASELLQVDWNRNHCCSDQDKISAQIRDADPDEHNSYLSSDNTKVTDGSWHHYTIVKDGNSIRIYIDGQSQGISANKDPLSTIDNFNNANGWQYPLYIGARNLRGNDDINFQGSIDEVRIYSKALNVSEISQDMNTGINGTIACTPTTEVCDGVDNDCDGQVDEGSVCVVDNDGDGYNSTVDCNDNDAAINPGAAEICDGVDNNCNGQTDEGLGCTIDNDGDGYNSTIDCNDNNAAINPGATEVCDGVDNNCDGQVDEGCPPSGKVEGGPNEPANFNPVVGREFNTIAGHNGETGRGIGSFPWKTTGSEGWDDHEQTESNILPATDPTSPFSPPNVVAFRYPVQTVPAGTSFSPGQVQALNLQNANSGLNSPLALTEIYHRYAFKLPSNFQVNPSVNGIKIVFYRQFYSGSTLVNGPYQTIKRSGGKYYSRWDLQGTEDNARQISATGNNEIKLDTWYEVEALLRLNDAPGVPNGEIHVWIKEHPNGNRIKIFEYTDILLRDVDDTGSTGTFSGVRFDPVFGGQGGTINPEFLWYLDHSWISGR